MKLGVNGRFLGAVETGVQRFAREVCRRLTSRTEVTLFLPRGVPEPGWDCATRTGVLQGPPWEQLELPRAAARSGSDLLLNPANAAPRWGPPRAVVLHDVAPQLRPADFTAAYRLWSSWAHVGAARRAQVILTTTGVAAAQVERVTSRPAGSVVVVSQGVEPFDRPAPASAVAAARKRRRLPERYFLAMGAHDPRKNLGLLMAAFGRWRAGVGDETALAVVGERQDHIHRPASRHAPDGVLWLGRVPDDELRALYTGSVALLFPSSLEGFGRPPLEALGCGTRALVGPYDAAEEVLGDAADVVACDEAAWVGALDRVTRESPGERRRRIERGLLRAGAYRWDTAVERVLEACRDAVRRSRR